MNEIVQIIYVCQHGTTRRGYCRPAANCARCEAVVKHPDDIRTHPLEDCPVCQELGDWASCEDSIEWIEAHAALVDLRESVEDPA